MIYNLLVIVFDLDGVGPSIIDSDLVESGAGFGFVFVMTVEDVFGGVNMEVGNGRVMRNVFYV